MANLYQDQGKYDLALEVYESVLETKIRECGQDSLDVATSKYNIASVKETRGGRGAQEGARQVISRVRTDLCQRGVSIVYMDDQQM
jgi:hypothetical protein